MVAAFFEPPQAARSTTAASRTTTSFNCSHSRARALDERCRDLDLVGVPRERCCAVELAVEQPRHGGDAGKREARRGPAPHRRNPDERERPALALHRLQVDGRVAVRHLDGEHELTRLERGRPAVVLRRQPVERRDRQAPLASSRAWRRARAAQLRRRRDVPMRRSRWRRSRAPGAHPPARSTRRRRAGGTAS